MRHFDSATTATTATAASVALAELIAGALLLAIGGCGGAASDGPPRAGDVAVEAPLPGEEPLETESIGDEEVQGLPPEPSAPGGGGSRGAGATERRGPCGWAEAFRDPDAPNPLVAGVGHVGNPTRITETPVRIPARDPLPRGDIVVEFVVGPDGRVTEAHVVKSTEPPWPSADRAVEASVLEWRYQPVTLDGTPIAVCQTAFVSP